MQRHSCFFSLTDEASLDNMIVTVVREHHWSPDYIMNSLYLDDIDCFGLRWWYDDVQKCIEKIEET